MYSEDDDDQLTAGEAAYEAACYETFAAADLEPRVGKVGISHGKNGKLADTPVPADEPEEPDSGWTPACPVQCEIYRTAQTVGEMVDRMKAHRGTRCVHCASTEDTVVSDRLVLQKPAAVCCGEVA